jgi:PIN domain nuclease of toxin-antitoxin system
MGSGEITHLLDTHVWIQSTAGALLPPLVGATLEENANNLAIADISLWEVAKLVELGRLELTVSLKEFFQLAITPELTVLPLSPDIAASIPTLESSGFHKDPADQIIVATALVHRATLVSNDTRIRQWGGVPILWKSFRS